MDDCLALRIAAVFVLAIFSFLGVLLPLAVSEEQRKSDIFIIIKTGAAGVMLGLCLVSSTILPSLTFNPHSLSHYLSRSILCLMQMNN